MRVRLTVSLSGSEYCFRPGEEADLDTAEAGRLIAAGFAVAVGSPTAAPSVKPETTESPSARSREKAVSGKGK